MATLIFNDGFRSFLNTEKDVLSAFKPKSGEDREIRPGMSPDELADIVSDRLIEVIKQQFAETEKKYLTEKQ